MRNVLHLATIALIVILVAGCGNAAADRGSERASGSESLLAETALPTTAGMMLSVVDTSVSVTVVQLVDAGCNVCVLNYHSILRVLEKLSASPIALRVSVSGASPAEARTWAASAGLPDSVAVLSDESRKLRSLVEVTGIPAVLILDRAGRIGAQVQGHVDLPLVQDERIEAAILSVLNGKP
jgi:hypothetical protein